MKNWKLNPQQDNVARVVDCYWFLEREPDDKLLTCPKLNPDPAAHLIMASHNHTYQYDSGSVRNKGMGSHWLFPHSQTLAMDHSKPFVILGIKFHVGALYSLTMEPKQPMINHVMAVDLKDILQFEHSQKIRCLLSLGDPLGFSGSLEFNLLKAAEHPQACRDLLDTVLQPWLFKSDFDKHSLLVKRAYPLLHDMPITKLGVILHCSQRTLERSFLRVTGMTLKQCQQMEKLETLLHFLQRKNEKKANWVDIAQQFGFSDQPHLIRYLKDTLGQTPGEYALKRDVTIDIYGDFESH
ncbi:helix-turn-helix domain-containing protein [Shewanella surugensis]|uniref:Helix-turn-helix domain-containing protein n=1 Tax=Shewanella surugensis TaxID=212020 RepID=A0ABT0LIL1_9GAMM|nr:helix-turn-helix domain-containing protein [Shewanella surugensis]MCL1127526.1 helix-turn-helix domain-containing protein [Shewanella surugensis]